MEIPRLDLIIKITSICLILYSLQVTLPSLILYKLVAPVGIHLISQMKKRRTREDKASAPNHSAYRRQTKDPNQDVLTPAPVCFRQREW